MRQMTPSGEGLYQMSSYMRYLPLSTMIEQEAIYELKNSPVKLEQDFIGQVSREP